MRRTLKSLRKVRSFHLYVALLACVVASPMLTADEYQAGQAAYESGDYELTLNLWLKLANAGDQRAQFGLGTLYFEGLGVELELEKSVLWFRRAGEQGYAPAQFNLGNAYKHGRGVRQDDTAANEWWLRAASQDFAPAQFNLATQYYFGRGVELNETEAIRWYRRAADNGHPRAKEMFAGETSDVVTVDAVEWIRSQSPSHFTIQLLASTQQASADVLARHPSFPSNKGLRISHFCVKVSSGTPLFMASLQPAHRRRRPRRTARRISHASTMD